MDIQDEIEMEKIRQQLLFRDSHEPKESEKTDTTKQVAAGKKGRDDGHKYENALAEEYGLIVLDGKLVKSIHKRKTKRKTDAIDPYGGHKYSIKNSNNETQIHKSPFSTYSEALEMEKGNDEYIAMQQFLGSHDYIMTLENYKNNPEVFNSFVETEWGLNPNLLDPNDESRRSRIKIPNTIGGGQYVLNHFMKNKRKILEIVLQKGMIHPSEEESIPDHMIWSVKPNDVKEIEVISIEQILDPVSLDKMHVSISPQKTRILVGPFAFQQHGSGKNPKGYHDLQARTSLKKLLEHRAKL